MAIPLDRKEMTQEMLDAAANALASEDLLFGESVAKFEEEFARFCGTDFAVSVNSGTDALTFCLMAAGASGRTVLTTPASFIATANAAFHAGGRPSFCDVRDEDVNIDPLRIKRALARVRKVSSIVPVHLHGHPAGMDEILELAARKGIFVLEDACQAHGAEFYGKRAGAIGDAGCFSFNPFKNMTVGGDGGMVVTNDAKLARKVRILSDAGRESPYTHEHAVIGYTSRINTVNAAIGRVQLRHLEEWNERRRQAAETYSRLLADADGLRLPPAPSGKTVPVYNKFAIRAGRRDALKEHLLRNGIECDSHYPIPIHLQPPYRKLGYKKGDYPVAERFAGTTLSLPMFPSITKEEIEYVCGAVKGFFGT
jgi:perosamine synthetase